MKVIVILCILIISPKICLFYIADISPLIEPQYKKVEHANFIIERMMVRFLADYELEPDIQYEAEDSLQNLICMSEEKYMGIPLIENITLGDIYMIHLPWSLYTGELQGPYLAVITQIKRHIRSIQIVPIVNTYCLYENECMEIEKRGRFRKKLAVKLDSLITTSDRNILRPQANFTIPLVFGQMNTTEMDEIRSRCHQFNKKLDSLNLIR